MTFGAGFGFPRARFPMGAAPTLNMDFAGTAALPPYVTFSRGTNATYVDSLGNIAYAPSNLLTYSEQFDNAAWSKFQATISANTTTAPDGTSTAEKLIESSGAAVEHGTNRAAAVAITAGSAVTLSIYAKADTRSRVSIALVNGSYSVGARYTFNLISGVVSAVILTGTPISYSASSQNVGNGWYRCVITAILDTASTTANFNVATDNGTTFFYAGDGVSGLYIWGAQLNLDGLQPYNSTTVKNLLGYTQDFDNAAWTKSNSFIQTNLLTYSEQFDNAAWSKFQATISANTTAAPDGTSTAEKLIESSGAAVEHGTNRAAAVAIAAGSAITISIYAKADTRPRVSVGLVNGSYSVGARYTFDLTSGVVSAVVLIGTPISYSASSQNVGDGWYRCVITAILDTASTTANFNVATDNGTTFFYAGDGVSGLYIWGAQVVQGATPGDYQATTTAALAVQYRAPDGSLTADKLVETTAATSQHVVFRSANIVANTPQAASGYFKAGERTRINFRLLNGTFNSGANVTFDLSDGTVPFSSAVGTGANLLFSITSVGSGWYRCFASCIVDATSTSAVWAAYTVISTNNDTYTGDGTSGIYIWGAQLSDSASLDPYSYNFTTAPTAAAYYGPRFDYDPVTLACKGLLIEEQRTNSIRNNTMQGATAPSTLPTNWLSNVGGLTLGVVGTGTENGITYIDVRFSGTTTQTFANVRFDGSTQIAAANGQTWSSSFYARMVAGSITNITSVENRIQYRDIGGASVLEDVSNFTSTVSAASLSVARRPYTLTATSASTAFINSAVSLVTPNGAVIDITLRIGLPQLELGAFATSVIPTTTTAVTRAADVAVIQGANFSNWYTQSEGTLYAAWTTSATGTNRYILDIEQEASSSNRIDININTLNVVNPRTVAGGAAVASLSGGTYTINTVGRVAFAYKAQDYASSLNGVAAVTATTAGVLPPTLARMFIGSLAGATQINGHIARIAYYPTRQPNATLQAITT